MTHLTGNAGAPLLPEPAMTRSDPSPRAASRRKAGTRIAAALAALLIVPAGQANARAITDLLFGPSISKDRNALPNTYGGRYDCRRFSGDGWKGIASGRVINFGENYMVSQAGCFLDRTECRAWLMMMSGFIDQPRYMRCDPHHV